MDIQTGGGLDGFEAAKLLRHDFDGAGRVAFLTATSEYALSGYRIGIWDYILKPAGRERIWDAVSRAADEVKAAFAFIPVGNGLRKCVFARLVFAEASRRQTKLHLLEDVYTTRLALGELLRLFPRRQFCQVHCGYAVNFNHVTRIKRDATGICLCTSTEARIPVGRTYRRLFDQYFEAFLRASRMRPI
jgi:DNA-binding LytR/AlgR family response regulator